MKLAELFDKFASIVESYHVDIDVKKPNRFEIYYFSGMSLLGAIVGLNKVKCRECEKIIENVYEFISNTIDFDLHDFIGNFSSDKPEITFGIRSDEGYGYLSLLYDADGWTINYEDFSVKDIDKKLQKINNVLNLVEDVFGIETVEARQKLNKFKELYKRVMTYVDGTSKVFFCNKHVIIVIDNYNIGTFKGSCRIVVPYTQIDKIPVLIAKYGRILGRFEGVRNIIEIKLVIDGLNDRVCSINIRTTSFIDLVIDSEEFSESFATTVIEHAMTDVEYLDDIEVVLSDVLKITGDEVVKQYIDFVKVVKDGKSVFV